MKRFLKVLALLVVALFALVSGLDVTLDHLARAASQSAFTCYNQNGRVVAAYNGNMARLYPQPRPVAPASVLHPAGYTPPSID
jgi:hypothetical protein